MNKDLNNTGESKSPLWLEKKNTINEVVFCDEFVAARPLKCIKGRFYGIDGEIPDSVISYEISEKLTEFITNNISRKVKSLLEALKLYCFSESLPLKQDEIHLLNGVYYPTNLLLFLIDMKE